MIVACPDCNKRYQVENALIPGEGRRVRCASCGSVWHQKPDVVQEMAQNPQIQALKDVTRHTKRKYRISNSFLGWGSFGLCTIAVFGFLLIEKTIVITHFPQMKRLYSILGLPNPIPGEGLTLTNTNIKEASEGHFVVRGDVLNASNEVRGLSTLRVKAFGKAVCDHPDAEGQCILKEWALNLDPQSLLPGEQVHFESTPYPLVKGTIQVGVSF